MNMKKIGAGVLASVVAVSAMATMAVSAKTINQKADKTTWTMADYYSKEVSWNATTSYGANLISTGASNSGVAGLYNIAFGAHTGFTISDVKIEVKGTQKGGTAELVKTAKLKDITAAGAATQTFQVKFNGMTGNGFAAAEDVLDFSAFATSGAAGIFAAGDIKDMKISYKVTDKTVYTKAPTDADKAVAKVAGVTITPAAVTAASMATEFNVMYPTATVVTATSCIAKDNGTVSNKGGEVKVVAKNANNLNNIVGVGDLGTAMVQKLEGTKGSKITFSFKEEDKTDDGNTISGNGQWSSSSTKETFQMGINNTSKLTNASDLKITGTKIADVTFDWDAIVAANEYAGKVGLINNLQVYSERTVVVTSVTVDVPAKTFEDLAAGEGVEVTTEAIATTAAVADTTAAPAATTPATNPTTGNAPIALAIIPVALVAAAIIAKKRG